MTPGKDFDDAVVVITGASSGLGRAIAVEVAARGAKAVAINYASSQTEAEETADQVRAMGAEPILAKGDVADDGACHRIVEAVARFGRIDALFNNAGMTKQVPNHADLDGLSDEDFVRIYRVNVVGAFQMVRAARALLEAGAQSGRHTGAVVNTSSIAGVTGIGSSVAYAASKGALTTMTLSLARALAPKIRVNAVCPGFIDTPWFGKGMDEERLGRLRQSVIASTPLNLASKAEDIAGPTVFLASPAAAHITGETLLVDAGTHLGFASLSMR